MFIQNVQIQRLQPLNQWPVAAPRCLIRQCRRLMDRSIRDINCTPGSACSSKSTQIDRYIPKLGTYHIYTNKSESQICYVRAYSPNGGTIGLFSFYPLSLGQSLCKRKSTSQQKIWRYVRRVSSYKIISFTFRFNSRYVSYAYYYSFTFDFAY